MLELYIGIYLLGVLISSISQVLLKKAALRTYDSPLKEYLNPLVIFVMRLVDPGMQAGWPSLMATVLTCSGLIILFLGIIGEYLGRMFMTINNAPQYVLKETIDHRATTE